MNKEPNDDEKNALEDCDKVSQNEQKLHKLFENSPLRKFAKDLPMLLSLLKDFATRKYLEVPIGTVSAILFALLYVLAPFDAVSDMLPVIGYLDDASVVMTCLRFIETDLENYRQWKAHQQEPAPKD